jgi:nucleotide-binding universal stress UspA family protein
MKRILVGVDGSGESRAALRTAAELARLRSGEIWAVRAWQYPASSALPWSTDELPAVDEVEERIGRDLRAVVAEEVGEGVPTGFAVERGQAANAILTRAVAEDVDAIVTGSRGRGGFAGLVLGSVTRQLADHTPRPLVVVRDTRRAPAMRRIVVAVDGSEGSMRALRWATDLARDAEAEVVAAHALSLPTWEYDLPADDPGVSAAAEELATEWCAPLAEAGVPHRSAILDGDPRLLVPRLADEVDADLVVAGTRGHTGIAKVLLGSVATHLLHHEHRPLALVP